MSVDDIRWELRLTLARWVDLGEAKDIVEDLEALIDAKVQQAITETIDGLQANGYIPV